ncbi:MAG: hypothetical protein R3F11_15420 [Verrucomicrobiales bacterium]
MARRRRSAKAAAAFSAKGLLRSESAWIGVIVCGRLGAATDGSGQSSDSSIGLPPERAHSR